MTKHIVIKDAHGGAPILLEVIPAANNTWQLLDTTVSGLQLSTEGVTDYTDLRFVTDAQLADLVLAHNFVVGKGAVTVLASGVTVDMNVEAATTLLTVGVGLHCVVTGIVVRAASASLDTASYSVGYNSATYNDVVADAVHAGLDGADKAIMLSPIATGFPYAAAAAVLKLLVNTAQGSAATAKVDVLGYYV